MIKMIDVHAHIAGDTAQMIEALTQRNVKILNIAVAHDYDVPWRQRRAIPYRNLAAQYPDAYAWCTTFDLPDFTDPQYASNVIAQLERDFADGAIACKVWKNIGMGVRTPSGEYMQVDDPILAPIFAYLEKVGKPLLMHLAEPYACWMPLGSDNPYTPYLTKNPKHYLYQVDGAPSHADIIQARHRMMERYPNLTFIGAHLGSQEYNVAEIAKCFDRFPNYAVDTSGSARIRDLALQDTDVVRAFCIKYQDRIMYGSDQGTKHRQTQKNTESLAALSTADQAATMTDIFSTYDMAYDYFATDKQFALRGENVRGLALPTDVVGKIFYDNVFVWYPEMPGGSNGH